jgi:phage-related minor tail protein
MENCYEGIVAQPQIPNTCNGNITSTDCIASPVANVTLDLPEGASQTQINNALTTALVYKQQQIEELIDLIEDLTARIVILETV